MKAVKSTSLVLLLLTVPGFILADLSETVVVVDGKETSIYCSDGTSGKLKIKDSQSLFKSYSNILRAKKKKARSGDIKAKKQARKLRKLKKAGDEACQSLKNGGGSEPTPTPSGGDTYFDRNGNVTALGAEAFQIPSGYQANAYTGQGVWESYCQGCHEKRTRPTYPLLREAISQEPMYYDEDALSMQEAVDLTAYLNIFRTP